jgi:hypothetical protein
MKWILIILVFIFSGCSIKYNNINISKNSPEVVKLTTMITSMDSSIDKNEAKDLATFSIPYTKKLANSYGLVLSPNFQNFLVNIGLKKKGYCYNYADDLGYALVKRGYKSFDIYRIIHKRGTMFEHNAIMITPHYTTDKGVVLDGWRDAGKLYFCRKKDDEYDWKIFKKLQ